MTFSTLYRDQSKFDISNFFSLDASILAHETTEARSLSNADEDQEPDASELFPIQPLTESQLPHDQTTLIPEFIENQRVLEDNITTNEEKDTYPQSAYHEYSQPYPDPSFMQPPPIPPPSTTEEAELFSNVIMSWYYAGYYTAMYQVTACISH